MKLVVFISHPTVRSCAPVKSAYCSRCCAALGRGYAHIGDAEALCMDGSAAAYQAGQAKEYKTIEMEEAMRLLGQERRAG